MHLILEMKEIAITLECRIYMNQSREYNRGSLRKQQEKRFIACAYSIELSILTWMEMPDEPAGYLYVYWMFKIVLDEQMFNPAQVITTLWERGIETKPGFIAFSDQKKYWKNTTAPLRLHL